jgi:SAM-dependent methyltransferase
VRRDFSRTTALSQLRFDPSNSMPIPRAKSVTHAHILRVINSELAVRAADRAELRILDAGCGDGELLRYLASCLPGLNPDRRFAFYGFDLTDPGVQRPQFLERTTLRLSSELPEYDWHERLAGITANSTWPYEDEVFDVVVSNQVLEHVADHHLFLAETRRTLRQEGFSVHLFPLKHYLYEGHLNLPFVHWITDHSLLKSYIRTMSRLGLGKYRLHARGKGGSLEEYVERHADYMHHFTNYLSSAEILRLAKAHGLRASFKYTPEFYRTKLESMLGREGATSYCAERSSVGDWAGALLLRHISSITLFLEKKQTYARKAEGGS